MNGTRTRVAWEVAPSIPAVFAQEIFLLACDSHNGVLQMLLDTGFHGWRLLQWLLLSVLPVSCNSIVGFDLVAQGTCVTSVHFIPCDSVHFQKYVGSVTGGGKRTMPAVPGVCGLRRRHKYCPSQLQLYPSPILLVTRKLNGRYE